MPRNAGLELVDFRGNARVLEISCPFLGVTKIEKRVRKLLAPPPTPATLCTTPAYGPNREPKETKPVSRRTMTARRVATLTPVQSHGPPENCDKFTYQMRSSTRHRNPNLQHNLLRQPTATRNTDATSRFVLPLDPAVSTSRSPSPPYLGHRIRDRPHGQKLLYHHRMPVPRSPMQRRVSILRRVAALHQANSANVRWPPFTPAALCITKPRKVKGSD